MTTTPPAPVASMAKAYDPAEVEPRLYAWWEASGFFHADPDDPGEPFAIAMPPPNVTGALHFGHALGNTVQDAFVRRARMQGRNAVWLPGMDHAGIATQAVVDRQLAAEGLSRHDLGRQAFLERVWQFKERSGGQILRQTRRLGGSCDWDREAFTLDGPRAQAVREAFVTLHEQGLLYRGHRIINWCPYDRTALSDIEVDHEDEEGELAELRYPSVNSDPTHPGRGITVATTRAETMLGDTAVAVHPDDERYRDLVGTMLRLPLMDREIPVVADAHVDPAFGTGAVKVTPAHDANDYAIGQRHGLQSIDIFTDDARVNANGGPYEGLDRFAARARVKEDLAALGLLVRVELRRHSVGHCSRCGTVVEPRLSDQWFVRTAPLAGRAIAALRDGRVRFVPQRNAGPFVSWLENLHDWCVSRQLWWGHRIPAWYADDGTILVLREDPSDFEIAERGLRRDPDVLDTWFSSQLWPFTTLGWTGPGTTTTDLATWYPNAVLETGYDINAIWVSRMLMAGLHFLDEVPFKVVYNHGLVRDQFGKKMSKSVGNVIDPVELIDAYGADALRFALLRAAAPGQDAPFAEEWVRGGQRFANKLWNAARFVLSKVGDTPVPASPPTELLLEDRWVLSRLEAARAEVEAAEWDLARSVGALYEFVWDEYCDWYLEIAKLREDHAAAEVLLYVLDQALRLLHPTVPFITEELWRTLHRAGEAQTLSRAAWPVPAPAHRNPQVEAEFGALQETVVALRRFRADHRLPSSARLTVAAVTEDGRQAVLEQGLDGVRRLAGVGEWSFVSAAPPGAAVGRVVLAGAELYIPLEGLVDLAAERARLAKDLAKAQTEVARASAKLANERFVAGAKPNLVDAERAKLAEWEQVLAALTAQQDQFGASA